MTATRRPRCDPARLWCFDTRYSESDGTPLVDLDWDSWWPDGGSFFGTYYLHVRHRNGDTAHRVYPRGKAKRANAVESWGGRLAWRLPLNVALRRAVRRAKAKKP